jgi:uncharacterized damage-inducible protein DinB
VACNTGEDGIRIDVGILFGKLPGRKGIAQTGEPAMTVSLVGIARSALIGELEGLHQTVRQFTDELSDQQLWVKPIEPGNSVGHLILHLTGNLNHFVGAHLGKTGYVRDREREFTETQVPARAELLKHFDDAVAMFRRVVSGLSEQQLTLAHPDPRFGLTYEALVHLVAHFALHRGQMSYIVRLVKAKTASS